MDFSAPYKVITPTLEGPILRALAGVETTLTRTQILNLVEGKSEAGVRKALARLVEQGIVTEERVGSRYSYYVNREHLLWPSVEGLLRAGQLLQERVEELTSVWEVPPLSVELFGSVADGSSDTASDVDILVVRRALDAGEREVWERQIEDLTDQVARWTGNGCDVVVLSPEELAAADERREPILRSPRSQLAGHSVASITHQMSTSPIAARTWRSMSATAAAQARVARLASAATSVVTNAETAKSIAASVQKMPHLSADVRQQMQQAERELAVCKNVGLALRAVAAAQESLGPNWAA
jgi:predicted nucleotidyltransferase